MIVEGQLTDTASIGVHFEEYAKEGNCFAVNDTEEWLDNLNVLKNDMNKSLVGVKSNKIDMVVWGTGETPYVYELNGQNFYSINDAIASISPGSTATIKMLQSEYKAPDEIILQDNINLTITSVDGLLGCLIKSDSNTGNLFYVSNNSASALNFNNIQIEGIDTGVDPIIYVDNGSTVNIAEGTKFANSVSSFVGAAICINYGTMNMSASEICDNTASSYSSGSGVGLLGKNGEAIFNMAGGSIYDNHAAENGGGICIENESANFSGKCVVMQNTVADGEISNVYTGENLIYIVRDLGPDAKIGVDSQFYKLGEKFAENTFGKALANVSNWLNDKDGHLMGHRGDNLTDIVCSNKPGLGLGPEFGLDLIQTLSPDDNGGQPVDDLDSYSGSLTDTSDPVLVLLLVPLFTGLVFLSLKLHLRRNKKNKFKLFKGVTCTTINLT